MTSLKWSWKLKGKLKQQKRSFCRIKRQTLCIYNRYLIICGNTSAIKSFNYFTTIVVTYAWNKKYSIVHFSDIYAGMKFSLTKCKIRNTYKFISYIPKPAVTMVCSCYFQVLINCIRFNYLNCFCLIYRSDYTLWRLIHRLYEMRNYVIKCNYVLFALAWYERYIPQYVLLMFHNVLFQKYTHALFREPYTFYKVESKIWCKVVFPTFWKY